MEIAIYSFGFVSAVLLIVLTIVSLRGHYYLGLWLGVAAYIAAGLGGGCWLHDYWRKQDAASASATGTLKPGNGTSNELRALAQQWGRDSTLLLLGSKVVVVAKAFPYTVIRQDGADMLKLERSDTGELLVTAKLFDAFGNPIGDVTQNRFDLDLPDGYEHSSGDHYLTILDEAGATVLKIELVYNQAIRIQGSYHLRGGEPIRFGEMVEYLGASLGISMELPSPALCVEGDGMGFGGCLSQLRDDVHSPPPSSE